MSSTSTSSVLEVSADGEDAARQSEQRVRAIQIVNLRQDDAAALVASRRVHLTVVLVGVPPGKVLAEIEPRRNDASDRLPRPATPARAGTPDETGGGSRRDRRDALRSMRSTSACDVHRACARSASR